MMEASSGSFASSPGGERRFWMGATAFFGGISFLKGFRWPGRWAATQAQVDYGEGFSKRGFFGSTATRLLQLNHYDRFAVFSTLLLLLLFVLIFRLALSSGLVTRLGDGQPLAIFAASYSIVFLTHLNGYLDIVLGVLTASVLFVRNVRLRLALTIPVVVPALLIHEEFLLVFLPLLLMSFVLQTWSGEERPWRTAVLLGTAGIALLALVVSTELALHASLSRISSTAALARLQLHADFPPCDRMFSTF